MVVRLIFLRAQSKSTSVDHRTAQVSRVAPSGRIIETEAAVWTILLEIQGIEQERQLQLRRAARNRTREYAGLMLESPRLLSIEL